MYATFPIPAFAWIFYSITIIAMCAFSKRWIWILPNVFSLLIAFFGIGSYSTGTQLSGEADLRVMTLNVQLFRDHSPGEVASTIAGENPDIVCLQELPKDGNAQEFASVLREYRFVQHKRLGILSKHPIKRVYNWNLGTHGRYLLAAEIVVHEEAVLVIDAHLQHFPSDDIRAIPNAARNIREESKALASIVDKHRDRLLILAGDLNSVPQGSVNRMLRRNLTDSFSATSRGYGFTIPATRPVLRIDYIYVGNDITAVHSKVVESVSSDHRAVVAGLNLR